jgi:hypothetical protein
MPHTRYNLLNNDTFPSSTGKAAGVWNRRHRGPGAHPDR